MSAKEEKLDEIIDESECAKEHYERASKVAKSAGDANGEKEFETEANRAKQLVEKYKSIRDRKRG